MKTHQIVVVILTVVLLISVRISVVAQEGPFHKSPHKTGLMIGYGNHMFLEVAYEYQVFLFQVPYYYTFFYKKSWQIEFLLQPQYNLSKFREVDEIPYTRHGYEAGLNAGFLIRKHFQNDLIHIYIAASTGPHYISGSPTRQTPGFLFANNFFLGSSFKIDKKLYIDIRPGYRHMSNGGLKNPNKGINSFIISGGVMIVL